MALISVEEIGLCRSGPDNDVDLEAVYGGRISGTKEKDLKVNPLYNDRNSVTQYSDINGNMSPVHVVTYESFPLIRTKTLPSENSKIQNGHVHQNSGEKWTENSNNVNDLGVSEVVESVSRNRDKTDSNHNIQEETKNKVRNGDNSNIPKLVHLKHKDSESCGENSGINGGEINNSRRNINNVSPVDDVITESENSRQHSKGFHKDYGLLSYNNKSYVLDEKDIVIIPKQTEEIDPNTSPCHEIQNNSEPENNAVSKAVVEESSVNPNSEQVEALEPKVSDFTENTPLEIPNNDHLPESTYHEIFNVCDMQKLENDDLRNSQDLPENIQEDLSNIGDSPQICHKEIVTEVLVHNTAVLESPRMHFHAGYSEGMCCSFDTKNNPVEIPLQADSSDWPDIDALVRPVQEETLDKSVAEIAQNDDCRTDTKGHVRSVSDVVIQEKETNEDTEYTGDKSDDCDGSSLYTKKQTKKKSNAKAGVVSEAGSSTRTLKSILSNSSSHHSCSIETDHKCQNSDSEIHESKTVKFSKDTVFNENKSNKYKKEKFGQINLRELYRGKIMSDAAIAKLNPLYQSDENRLEGGEGEESSPTDNEKLTYELTLRNAMRLSKEKPPSLNGPSYLEQYLILKAHGIKKDDIDIEKLPEIMERPVYDRLIQRTLAKERRKVCVKWSMVILTVAVITAVAATLGVYFKEGF